MTEDRRKRTPTSRHWECAFPQPAAETVDEAVDEMWKTAFGGRTPFGDLRNQFRRQHCRTLNPYNGDDCPYDREQCALAFLDSVRRTIKAHPRVPVGYFRTVAKTLAAQRADTKPLTRDRPNRKNVLVQSGGRKISESDADQGGNSGGSLEKAGGPMPRVDSGPITISELFGSLGIQPRPDVERTGSEQEGEG